VGRIAVADMITLARLQSESRAVSEFDVQRTVEAKKNVTLGAPVVGNVAG
jgi:hypothetical protein